MKLNKYFSQQSNHQQSGNFTTSNQQNITVSSSGNQQQLFLNTSQHQQKPETSQHQQLVSLLNQANSSTPNKQHILNQQSINFSSSNQHHSTPLILR